MNFNDYAISMITTDIILVIGFIIVAFKLEQLGDRHNHWAKKLSKHLEEKEAK